MFVFDNLLELDDKNLSTLIRSIDSEVWSSSLKGVEEAVRNRFLGCMSSRAADGIRDEMEARGPMKLAEVLEAQKAMIAIARVPWPRTGRSRCRAAGAKTIMSELCPRFRRASPRCRTCSASARSAIRWGLPRPKIDTDRSPRRAGTRRLLRVISRRPTPASIRPRAGIRSMPERSLRPAMRSSIRSRPRTPRGSRKAAPRRSAISKRRKAREARIARTSVDRAGRRSAFRSRAHGRASAPDRAPSRRQDGRRESASRRTCSRPDQGGVRYARRQGRIGAAPAPSRRCRRWSRAGSRRASSRSAIRIVARGDLHNRKRLDHRRGRPRSVARAAGPGDRTRIRAAA
jgi:hypothetical protein